MATKRAFRRHRKIEPSWKKEILQDRGKRDETPSALTGVLTRGGKASVLTEKKPQVLTGAALKSGVLR